VGSENLKVLVTGAGGFIGRNLVEALAAEHEVYGLTRRELDLLDADAVRDFFSRRRIDVVVHAAVKDVSRTDPEPKDYYPDNMRMFFNLERALPETASLFFLGSGAAYSRPHWRPKMTENYFGEFIPQDSYGFAKYSISKVVEHRSNMVDLRVFGVFGKYENYRFKFISNAILKNLLHMPIVIAQDVVFDYLYIDDLARIVLRLLAIRDRIPYRQINVTPTRSCTLTQVARMINAAGDFKSEIIVSNPGLGREYSGDNQRLLEVLGGYEFGDLQEAIRDLRGYYAERLAELDTEAIRRDEYLASCLGKTR
jgi:GDP-L-fucose synthase